MSSPAPFFELWSHCPHLACGESFDPAAAGGGATGVCPRCGSGYKICTRCRATNRLLVEFCRGCANPFEAEAFPSQAGLTYTHARLPTIGELGPTKTVHLGAGVVAQPLSSDGLVFVAQLDGLVTVVNAAAGRIVGQLFVGGRIEVAPALHSGVLFVAAGTRLHAFDLVDFLDQPSSTNFKPAWTVESAGDYITQPVVADSRAVYIVSRRGEGAVVEAIARDTGRDIWPGPAEVSTYMTLPGALLKDRLALVTQGREVYSFAPETGVAETYPLKFDIDLAVAPVVYGDNRVLLSDAHGYVFELVVDGPKTGAVPVHDHRNPVTSIAASDDFIAYGHRSGLALLNSHGDRRWAYDSYETISVTPILAGASIFALDDAGNGLLFNTLNANPKTKIKLLPNGEVRTPPVVAGRHVVAVSAEGRLVIIDWR